MSRCAGGQICPSAGLPLSLFFLGLFLVFLSIWVLVSFSLVVHPDFSVSESWLG